MRLQPDMRQVSVTPVKTKPRQSSGGTVSGFVSSMRSVTRTMPRMPNGTFRKNTQRHDRYVVMRPPTGGPMIGPRIAGVVR